MKSIYNYLTAPICLIATLLLAGSCSGEYEYKTDYASYKDAKLEINLVDENNTLQLKLANNTHQITVGVTPENLLIDLQAYIYQVSDESIAVVDKEGVLTMKKEGEAELIVKFRGNQELTTSCKVKITRDPIFVSDLKVPSTAQVQELKTLNLAALITVLPGTADNQTLHYEVANPLVATVNESGTVTGVKEGLTTITVTTADGTNISKTIPLTVVGEIKVSAIDLNVAAKLNGKIVGVGQVFNIGSVVTVLPANASNKEVTYSVEGNAVSVDEKGVVTTKSAGAAKVIVTATDGSGVKSEISFKVDSEKTLFERCFWTVDTSIRYSNSQNYVADGSTGMPEHMFDGDLAKFLSLVKPGKSYNGCVADPVGTPLFFVVDMGAILPFNYIQWGHRSNNNDALRAWAFSLSGSNDGTRFTSIGDNIELPHKAGLIEIDIPTSAYRYVKVEYKDWNKTTSSTIQVGEFNVGKR